MIFDLRTELRTGIPHFASGQHHAYASDDKADDALLVYVDALGWACLIPCEKHEGEWRPIGVGLRHTATGVRTGWRQLKDGYGLSDDARRALDSAEVVPDTELIKASGDGGTVLENNGD